MTSEDQKLKNLQAQIDALKAKTAPPKSEDMTEDARSMSVGVRAGTELVGATLGAALIGYGLDRWLGTKPWLMITLLVLGVFTGFMNIWKLTQSGASGPVSKNLPEGQKKSLANGDEPLK